MNNLLRLAKIAVLLTRAIVHEDLPSTNSGEEYKTDSNTYCTPLFALPSTRIFLPKDRGTRLLVSMPLIGTGAKARLEQAALSVNLPDNHMVVIGRSSR